MQEFPLEIEYTPHPNNVNNRKLLIKITRNLNKLEEKELSRIFKQYFSREINWDKNMQIAIEGPKEHIHELYYAFRNNKYINSLQTLIKIPPFERLNTNKLQPRELSLNIKNNMDAAPSFYSLSSASFLIGPLFLFFAFAYLYKCFKNRGKRNIVPTEVRDFSQMNGNKPAPLQPTSSYNKPLNLPIIHASPLNKKEKFVAHTGNNPITAPKKKYK
jgi:hypothetical protein